MESTIIFGSPGTGKTHNLIEQINDEAESGTPKENIYVLSHTNAAAKELISRNKDINASTIHSLAYRFGGFDRAQVIQKSELRKFSENIGVPMKGMVDIMFESLEVGDEYMAIINVANNNMESYEETYNNSNRPGSVGEFKYFYTRYELWKNSYGFIDFNDMISTSKYNKDDEKIEVLFVDEAQDLSLLQWNYIDNLVMHNPIKKVIVTGDPDQSLFIWGGADRNGMINFMKKYDSKIIELSQSHRVPKLVHELSVKVINRINRRFKKGYYPTENNGQLRYYMAPHLVEFDESDTLVLYRNHSLRWEVEEEIINKCLPYKTLNGQPGLFQDKYSNAIRIFNKIKNMSDKDTISAYELNTLRSVGTPKAVKFINNADFKSLIKMQLRHAIILPTTKTRYYETVDMSAKPNIKLSTIHGAKGMEADRVVILDGMTSRVVSNLEVDPNPEHQVWYVAVTRSKNKLDIINGYEGLGYVL